ncbi:hypothetical protein GOODEAATRI_013337 [Goodea atripinnis]|uniref:Fibronectin type-III domain-containing protein n=1 Tax=Goodea atripinnis TaxID=208336 RepID=A0ABV0N2E9_9TELE
MGNAPQFNTDVTDTSIVISWSPVPRIGYKAGENSCTLENLSPGVEYNVSVVTVKDDMESAPVSTIITPEVPQLTDLTFEGVTDTTISLRWSPLSTTTVTGYKITVVAAGESIPIFEDMVLPTSGQYTVHGLEPGIDYDISVTTVTEHGESEPTTFTQQTYLLPNTEYLVSVVCVYEQRESSPVVDQTEFTFSGLMPTAEYVFSVNALGQNGESSPLVVNAVTNVDRPKDLTFSDIDSTSLRITWDSPEGFVTSYRVLYASSEEGERELYPAPRGDVESAVIYGLQPGTEYTVKVIAMHDGTTSTPLIGTQATGSFITNLFGAISPPSNLQFSEVGPTSFTMRWTAPGQENLITGLPGLTGYRVVVNPKKTSGPTKEINLSPDTTQAHIPGLMVSVTEIH